MKNTEPNTPGNLCYQLRYEAAVLLEQLQTRVMEDVHRSDAEGDDVIHAHVLGHLVSRLQDTTEFMKLAPLKRPSSPLAPRAPQPLAI